MTAARALETERKVMRREGKSEIQGERHRQGTGVSPATVSLVLNNKPGVGEAKRREILEKIMEMDCEYLLKEGESHKGDIGLVIYKCGGQVVEEYPFFNYLSESITRTLEKNGYTMVVMYLDKGMPADEQYLALENAGCTGFIVYAVEMYPEDTEVFRRLSRPCVFLDNPFPRFRWIR